MTWAGLFVLGLVARPDSRCRAASSLDWTRLESEAQANLQGYLRIDTSNPPGDVSLAVSFLENLLTKEGIPTKRYPIEGRKGQASLLARLPGSGQGKPLLMLAHMDVVPVQAAEWKFPPFSAQIQDGELWGRGSLDMKGPGMIELMSLIALKREGFKPKRDLLLLFNPDEEAGGHHGAEWMADHHWADLDPAYVLDEGGSGTRGVYTDDQRVIAGVAVDEKRVLWLKVRTQGKGGHGSMPDPDNAVYKLSRFLSRVQDRQKKELKNPVMEVFTKALGGKLADNPVTRALKGTTVTATSFRAGVGEPPKVNVVPDAAEATLDCRLLPGESWQDLLAQLQGLGKDLGVAIEITQSPKEGKDMDWRSPLFDSIQKAVSAQWPGALTLPVLCTGGTDARNFRMRGVPAYGFIPLILSQEQKALWHSKNERIVLTDYLKGIRLYHDMLQDFLSGDGS